MSSRVVMSSLPYLTSPASVTLDASHPRPRPHSVLQQHSSPITLATLTQLPSQLRDPPVVTIPQERLHPRRRYQRHFSNLGIPLSRGITLTVALLYDMSYRILLILGHLDILGLICFYSYLNSSHASRHPFTSSP
ncbi:hypothetical protein CK203_103975 [Vitis vinifera]|uniref:Uncharacterized protein n=1 Tax=Vitis vinifera TaxID=29760 RepID=A0A438FIP8_VITVI|nr:hypothetical protein CK203_103975 [Vitis vinifera]